MFSRKYVMGAVAAAMMITLASPGTMASAASTTAQAVKVDMKTASDSYLKQNAGQYNLKSDISDLEYVTTIDTLAGSFVRYQQKVNGADLFSYQVTVTLDKSGNAVLVTSDYVPNLTVEPLKGKISENDAEAKALAHNAITSVDAPTSRTFGYTVVDGVAVPVYKVSTTANGVAKETMVHAASGKVLKDRQLNQNVNGTGKVFNPTPTRTAGTQTGFADNANADSTALTNQLKAVTLQGLDGTGYLKGTYVTIKNTKANTYSSTFAYNYTRANANFENVMAYYHIDTLQRYIQSIGFTNINNRSIPVNVNASTDDNSWYSPTTKDLTFGTGGVDDAEDATIIAHEYGHSIQDNQVPGFGATNQGGAMGEGFGDFLGYTYAAAVAPSTYFNNCVGEWDAVSYDTGSPKCLRRLDANKVYPGSMQNEVHADGEIWSQGEKQMADAFGRDIATKIILQSHFSLTPNSGFSNGVAAIKAADQTLYGGSHLTQINSIWAARGL